MILVLDPFQMVLMVTLVIYIITRKTVSIVYTDDVVVMGIVNLQGKRKTYFSLDC